MNQKANIQKKVCKKSFRDSQNTQTAHSPWEGEALAPCGSAHTDSAHWNTIKKIQFESGEHKVTMTFL